MSDRRMAKRYAHHTLTWRPCWRMYHRRWVCLRCAWREVTGRNRRDRAAEIRRVRGYKRREQADE